MRKIFIEIGAQLINKLVDDTYKYNRYIVKSVDENGDGVAHGIVAIDEKGSMLLSEDSVKITEKNAVRFMYLKNDEPRITPVEDKLQIVDGVIMYDNQPASKAGQGYIVAKSLLGVLPGVVVFTAELNEQKSIWTLDIERDTFKTIAHLTKNSEVEVVNSDNASLVIISKAKENRVDKKEDGTVIKTWDELIDSRYFLLSVEDGRHVKTIRMSIPGYPTVVNRFGEILAIEYQAVSPEDNEENYNYCEVENDDDLDQGTHVIGKGDENKRTMIIGLGTKGYRIFATLPVGDVTAYAYANGYITYVAGGKMHVKGYFINAKLPGYVSTALDGFTAIDSELNGAETSIFFVKGEDVKTVVKTVTTDRGDLYRIA